MAWKSRISILSVTVMGQKLDWPALAAPIGYSALMHKDGERGTARAARKARHRRASSPPFPARGWKMWRRPACQLFMQIYLLAGREAGEATLARCEAAGVKGLFLTIDTPVAGVRERDFRNGMNQLLGTRCFRQAALSARCPGASRLGDGLS